MFNEMSELANRFGLSANNPDDAKQLKRFEYNCYVYSKGGIDKVIERATELGVHDGSPSTSMTKDEFLLLVFKTINAEPGRATLSPLGKLRGDRMIEEGKFKGTEAEPEEENVEESTVVEEPKQETVTETKESKPTSMMDALGELFGNIKAQDAEKKEVVEEKTEEVESEVAVVEQVVAESTEEVVESPVEETVEESIKDAPEEKKEYVAPKVHIMPLEGEEFEEYVAPVENKVEDYTESDTPESDEPLAEEELEENVTGEVNEEPGDTETEEQHTEETVEEAVEEPEVEQAEEPIEDEFDTIDKDDEIEEIDEDNTPEIVEESKQVISELIKVKRYDVVKYNHYGVTRFGVLQSVDEYGNWMVTSSVSTSQLIKIHHRDVISIEKEENETVEGLDLMRVGDKVKYIGENGITNGVVVNLNNVLRFAVIAENDVFGARSMVYYNNIVEHETFVKYGTVDEMSECSADEVILVEANMPEGVEVIGIATTKDLAVKLMKAYAVNKYMRSSDTFITTKIFLNCYKGDFVK